MPTLEASPGPQGGRHRLQWVSLATQGPKVAGATPLPGEELGPSSHTSWSSLSVHTASQTLWNRALGWPNWTVQGRAGIHGEATTGVPRLASPHCPDLAWLLWPLPSPTKGLHPAGAPLPECLRHHDPLVLLHAFGPSPLGSQPLSSPGMWGLFGAGLGHCPTNTAHTPGGPPPADAEAATPNSSRVTATSSGSHLFSLSSKSNCTKV